MTTLIEMITNNINNYYTPSGRIAMILDLMSVLLLSFYTLGLGDIINAFFPPLLMVLTAISLIVSIMFKCASEYRAWKKRRRE